MAAPPPSSPTKPPHKLRPHLVRPKLRYELVSCALWGHSLIGTDTAVIRPEDRLVVREAGGLRWYRCLRCDSWVPYPLPEKTTREFIPSPDEIDVPLRGRPLRDRFVLRAIAVERMLHVVVLAAITAAIFLFAQDRAQLHKVYVRILSDLQGGLGGPIFDTHHGIFPKINELFALSQTELYLIGTGFGVYTTILVLEAVGLWFARRWAEYLTLVETGVLVPFEIYELAGRVSTLKIITLVLNLAIVLYLLLSKRLFGIRGGGRAERAEKDADTGWGAVERASTYVNAATTDWG